VIFSPSPHTTRHAMTGSFRGDSVNSKTGDVFCYLLGAGASCNAVPTVNKIPEAMRAFVNRLDEWHTKTDADVDPLRSATLELIEQVERHASIDTYAKKLFLKRDQKRLRQLKAVTSCFFVHEQTLKPADYRYDSFLASVIKTDFINPIGLPDNIRIVTWNYDTQLEKAFYGFCDDEKLLVDKITFNKNIKRLNGYCGTIQPGHLGPEFSAPWKRSEDDVIDIVISMFADYMSPDNSVPADIKFAWETTTDSFSKSIEQVVHDSTILIVIGYSFPFFNREIDQAILTLMASLKKVFVQVPADFHHAIEERLLALKPELPPIICLRDTSLFHIPHEYT
jgi:hypothetical protein